MDRRMVYTGALPEDLDVNQNAQFAMVSDGFLAAAVLGQTSWAAGLALAATSPASLSLTVGPGTLGTMSVIDQTNPGTSAILDTTDALMKIGVNIAATTIAFTAPATTGQSQVFLIQGQMQETDVGSTVLQYWNSANPTSPLTGPGGTGASQNTLRVQRVALQTVAGAPASTGSQTAPTATTGWQPLYLVTLANGQATITSASFAAHPSAPFVDPLATGRGVRPGRLLKTQYFTSSGTYTPTLGTNMIVVEVQGGGGPGCGAPLTGAGQTSQGGNGTSGSYARKTLTSGFQSGVAVTVGAGGVGASGTVGTAGGTSSFGTLVVAAGGNSGNNQGSTSNATYFVGAPSAPATPTTGDLNIAGTVPGNNFTVSQIGIIQQNAMSPAFGSGYGAGGYGLPVASSSAANTGGNGQPGIVIVHEYT